MSKIKKGFNDKLLSIRIAGYPDRKNAEVWVEQMGLQDESLGRYETLSYASIDELIELRDELNQAIKDMAGL